jgi:four helix bundle protein
MTGGGYQDLVVWQKAMALCSDVYRVTSLLPNSEKFGLMAQMRRAAVSIPSSIAEGHSRQTAGDFRHHLQIARGSVAELETQLLLCIQLTLVESQALEGCRRLCGELSRMLNALIKRLS